MIFSLQRIILISWGLTWCFLWLHPGGTGLGNKVSPACISASGVTRDVSTASLDLISHQIYQIWLSLRLEIVYITLDLCRWLLVPPLWRGWLRRSIWSSLPDLLLLSRRCKHIWHGAPLPSVLCGSSLACIMSGTLPLQRVDHGLVEDQPICLDLHSLSFGLFLLGLVPFASSVALEFLCKGLTQLVRLLWYSLSLLLLL